MPFLDVSYTAGLSFSAYAIFSIDVLVLLVLNYTEHEGTLLEFVFWAARFGLSHVTEADEADEARNN